MAKAKQNETIQQQLFYHDTQALDVDAFGKAGLSRKITREYAKQTNSIPLNGVEFIEAAKYYPIVFTSDNIPAPVVIVGLENENVFIGEDKQWKEGCYIPAYVRRYPFTFLLGSDQNNLVLGIDADSSRIMKKSPDMPFYNKEEATDTTKNAVKFCMAFHNHYVHTQAFCKALVEQDLLEKHQASITNAEGKRVGLGGFKVINLEKLRKLSPSTLADWQEKNWIAWAYYAVQSSSNWNHVAQQSGLIEPANKENEAKKTTKKAPAKKRTRTKK